MGFTSENKPEKQITMGILAHVDAGKTTLSEGILYTCKAIRKLGRVDHQDAFLDTNTLERNRGITIFSKQAECTLGEFGMTFLDTPGHVDFSAEREMNVTGTRLADPSSTAERTVCRDIPRHCGGCFPVIRFRFSYLSTKWISREPIGKHCLQK